MPKENLLARVELDRLRCHDEGDGPGSAEPYLWTVFFKIDGSSVSVTPALTLDGTATTHFTAGSHGNLGDTDVDEGDEILIPSGLGEWQTTLQPIPVDESLAGLVDGIGGFIGAVVVLMEEDNVSDDGAEAGHDALNATVRDALNQIVATRSFAAPDVTPEELAGFKEQITTRVKNAVRSQQNFFEDLWAWINPDDTIGFEVFLIGHDDLAERGEVPVSKRWKSNGDWEVTGSVTGAKLCPAEAFQELVDALLGGTAQPTDLGRLRRFRDGPFKDIPGLAPWWRVLTRHVPAIALTLRQAPDLLQQTRELLKYADASAADVDNDIDDGKVEAAARLARQIAERTRSRRLRIDADRAADVIPLMRRGTVREGLERLAAAPPARRQSSDATRGRAAAPEGDAPG